MFVRGGIDHDAARERLGRECENSDGSPNYLCAIAVRHRSYLNPTTSPWKLGDGWLDWYGAESTQTSLSNGTRASGSPADWTTNEWPDSFGPERSVETDGYGLEVLNTFGMHYWMLDLDMDCAGAYEDAEGTRWFEVKSFITGGPGWEPDVAQPGAPYPSRNHFAKCGMVNVFRRGESGATYLPLPRSVSRSSGIGTSGRKLIAASASGSTQPSEASAALSALTALTTGSSGRSLMSPATGRASSANTSVPRTTT
jgi:alpha-amylase